MKIGILGTRGIPNHYGGFEQFAQWLSKGLVDRGHEVYVYNSSHHPYQEKKWNGVHIIHCKDREYKIGTAGQFFYDLRCNRDAATRNFDVLFHFGYSSDSIWWKKWPMNTVNMVNMDGLEWKRTKYNALTRRFLKKAEYWAVNHADILIADSPAIRQHILDRYNKSSVYIPYAAEVAENQNPAILERYKLEQRQFYLLIARMEPENNIEMIIQGWQASGKKYPLVIVGSTSNKFGQYLVKKYTDPFLRYEGAIYDQEILNNLRTFSKIYFHGHSVGGTNPSLLEAMACGSNILAHDNPFNKGVLQNNAFYFSSAADISSILRDDPAKEVVEENIRLNKEKVRKEYDPLQVLDAYENLVLTAKKKPGA